MHHTKGTIARNHANERDEMIRIVESDEANQAYIRTIKNNDPKAFTKDGVIQSYKIDYQSIYHNPMGGVGGKLIINDDDNLTVQISLDMVNGHLKNQAGGPSLKLLELLRRRGIEK